MKGKKNGSLRLCVDYRGLNGSMNSVEWSGDWSGLDWTTGLDYWTGVEYWT